MLFTLRNKCFSFGKQPQFFVMRIFILLFCTSLFSFTVESSFAQQKISIESDQTLTVDAVFKIIKNQTEYSFIYPSSLFQNTQKIKLSKGEILLSKLINNALVNNGFDFEFSDNNTLILKKSDVKLLQDNVNRLQEFIISGVVSDSESGEVLPGVTVLVEGTTNGVVTDFDGNFLIKASKGDVLSFSYLGMTTSYETIENDAVLKIVLVPENKVLDEIVVVGFGSVKKQDLTSSVAKLNIKTIESRPLKNVGDALYGQLSGVRVRTTSAAPGAEPQIRIRGVNTINGDSDPLIVIDGIPGRELGDINPSDMESVQVLKDAAATAIYGSRGANGVILIETKKGNSKVPITNIEVISGISNITNTMDMMSPIEYLAYNTYYRNMRYLETGGSMSDPMSDRPVNLQIPDAWNDAEGTDWFDAITRQGTFRNYKLSSSQKSDNGSIFVSGGYLREEGVVVETYFNRLNFRMNGVLNLSKNVKFGMNIAPSYSDKDDRKSEGKESAIHRSLTNSPLTGLDEGTAETGYPVGVGQVYTNPLESLRYTTNNTRSVRFLTSTYLQATFLKMFTFKSQYSYDYRHNDVEYFRPANVARARGFPTEGSSSGMTLGAWTFQNTLKFGRKFAKKHKLNVVLGQSTRAVDIFRSNLRAIGWPLESLQTLNLAVTPTQASTDKLRTTGSSFFGRAQYDFKNKYLMSLSARYDGSSRFGDNNKWGFFPALSVGWKLNKERFLENISWMNLLKIRASLGQSGNDRIKDYSYLANLDTQATVYGDNIVAASFPSNIYNPNLKWETTTSRNLGLDANFFKNRIQISFDYFINTTDDVLFNAPVPLTTGFNTFTTNVGSVENSGLEFEINTVNTTGALQWRTQLNFSTLKNEIIDMGDENQFTSEYRGGRFISRVGGPVSQYYVYRTDGLLQPEDFNITITDNVNYASGYPKNVVYEPLVATLENNTQIPYNVKYVDQNDDGVINAEDLVPYGSNIPDLTYGFTNRFSWKNFELSILIQGQFGGDAMFLAQRQLDNGTTGGPNTFGRWVNSSKYNTEIRLGEDPTPDLGVDMSWDGVTPQPTGWGGGFNWQNDDTRIYDTTYLRIKNITFSYKLPKKTGFVKGGRVYFSAENLATFTDYPGFNPEVNTPKESNNTTRNGIDYTTYPLSQIFTLGLSLTF